MSETKTAQAKATPLGLEGGAGPRKVLALRVDQWTYEGQQYGRHEVNPDPRNTREDLLAPEFWVNIANKLRPGGLIAAHWMDGSAFAEYYVRRKSGSYVEVHELRYVKFPGLEELPKNSPYAIEFSGPAALWRVVRKSDKHVLRDKFNDEWSAQAWLRSQPWAKAA